MPMNPEVKKLWVEALESGEYKQGRGALRIGDNYCCLGVLCELHNNQQSPSTPTWDGDCYSGVGGTPADEVLTWAGLVGKIPRQKIGLLIDLNDSGTPFPEIAKYIKENL